jgi:hypothetical protein
MSQESSSNSNWTFKNNITDSVPSFKPKDLVMAWAEDRETSQPRYIFELDKNHRGAKCNCICPNCKHPLIAINVAKSKFLQRPHFKHRKGAQRDSCLVIAARFAIEKQLLEQGYIELPQRKVSSRFVGLSGKEYEAWEIKRPERVKIVNSHFQDKVRALLTLEDGRQILVELSGETVESTIENNPLIAKIFIDIGNDYSIAGMSPSELKERMTLLWAGACWHSHWADNELLDIASEQAANQAINELDWFVDDGSIPDIHTLTRSQKSETLLHLEVKRILEREKRIHLPELVTKVTREIPSTEEYSKETRWPAEFVKLNDVQLEKRLGRIIPDVVALVDDPINVGQVYSLLIEVTVTNTINDERITRISATDCATLEIDIGRMGGIITKEDLTFLVVDELVTKRWLYHPRSVHETIKLNAQIDAEFNKIKLRNENRAKALQTSLQVWINRYEEAYIELKALQVLDRRSAEEKYKATQFDERDRAEQIWLERLEDCIHALGKHGYPEANLEWSSKLTSILNRLFSIKFHSVVGYNLDSCWQVINTMNMDQDDSKTWHTLYLIAINEYNPPLTNEQGLKVQVWRSAVVESIKNKSSEYLRNTKYDKFLSLLFPEMKKALESKKGTQTSQAKQTKSQDSYKHYKYPPKPNYNEVTEDGWLKGKALQRWIQENPEAAKRFYGK